MRRVCRRHDALVAVNDRADVAYAAAPDVLHLGQDDLPVPVARAILGDEVLIGRSSHAPSESEAALEQPGVDYVAVGPCWPTPTKPGRPRPGLDLVRHVAELGSARPWFAIGGIDAGTVEQVLAAGATRVVVVRALTEAADPLQAARGARGGAARTVMTPRAGPPGAGFPRWGYRRAGRGEPPDLPRGAWGSSSSVRGGWRSCCAPASTAGGAGCCSRCCPSLSCSAPGTSTPSRPGSGRSTRTASRVSCCRAGCRSRRQLFFVVVPVASILALEAVRSARRLPVGDEAPGDLDRAAP